MPSAFFDQRRNGWIADYRGLFTKDHLRTRVPLSRILSSDTAKADAAAFAEELDRYCRMLERDRNPADVAHALRLGAITEAQANALLDGGPMPARQSEPLTIKDAATSHPSSQREKLPAKQWAVKCLADFQAHSGIKHLHLLTLDHVMRWIADLRKRGWSFDTRRHALSYLRRACVMGTRYDLPNVLDGMRIDAADNLRTAVRTWTMHALVTAITTTTDQGSRMALILGGCLGLRPTEILRAHSDDLDGDILHIGRREAKNDASRRALPIPGVVLGWIRDALGKRTTGALVLPYGPRCRDHYTLSGLHQLTAEALRGPPRIGPKHLRKTFASWAAETIPAADVERFLGHRTALHAAVTDRSYLAKHLAEQLRPSAKLMDAALLGILLNLKSEQTKHA